MHVTLKKQKDLKVLLTIVVDQVELDNAKAQMVQRLSTDVKVPGFRAGKAPAHLIEKQLDQDRLQTDTLEAVVNTLYVNAINQQKLRPLSQPNVVITKFVPFTDLEFTAEVEVLGDITLPEYKEIKVKRPEVKITPKEIDEVMDQLTRRDAERKEVKREAKDGDELIIDFEGVDTKTKDTIPGADGKDFSLLLGSNTFIPGFEPELVGLKAGANKTFDITFPKDYGTPALQNKKVTFTVTIHKVQELIKPKIDDAFAAKIGPFKAVDELKADIKRELTAERQRQADRDYENSIITKIAAEATVTIPKQIVDEQIERMEREERQNLAYQGHTWQEHLEAEGVTEEEHRERNQDVATERAKLSLVLSEISELENVKVTPEELDIRIQLLKGQYQDAQMRTELDKSENRQDIMNRLITEKTFEKLVSYSDSE